MKEKSVNSILKKYQNKLDNTNNYQSHYHKEHHISKTYRKADMENYNITFMNKQIDSNKSSNRQLNNQNTQNKQLIHNKHQYSKKNYDELWNALQLSRQKIKQLQQQIKFISNNHLQELTILQNKVKDLESQNKKFQDNLIQKQNTITFLKDKIHNKDCQLFQFQQYLKELSLSFNENMKRKQLIENEVSQNFKKKSQKQVMLLISKYQQQTVQLTSQLEKFDKILINKQKEKQSIAIKLEEVQKQHEKQVKQLKQEIKIRDDQLEKIMKQFTQEKIKIKENYESIIRQVTKSNFRDKEQLLVKQNYQIHKIRDNIKQFQDKTNQIQKKLRASIIQLQAIKKKNFQYQVNNNKLESQITNIKRNLEQLQRKNQDLNKQVINYQEKNRIERNKCYQFELKLCQQKRQQKKLIDQNQQFLQQNKMLKENCIKLKNIVLSLENDLEKIKKQENQYHQQLTISTINLKKKIQVLQKQKLQLQSDLYAQRLQRSHQTQQFKQKQQQIKKKYFFQLQNIKNGLEAQVSQDKFKKHGVDIIQKQEMYLKMRQLQRRYQLLTCQVITVEQMVGITEKVKKRHFNQYQKSKNSIKLTRQKI